MKADGPPAFVRHEPCQPLQTPRAFCTLEDSPVLTITCRNPRAARLPITPRPRRVAWALVVPAILALTIGPTWLPERAEPRWGGLSHAQTAPDVTPPAAVTDLSVASPTYYVDGSHPLASDSGPGTASTPWKTILHAVQTARAGETVLIKRGTYPENVSGRVSVANSGTPGKPITFAAYPGDERQVVISGAMFRIAGKSYIVVRGLKVTGVTSTSAGRGFSVEGPGTDITLTGNETYDTYSSGIGVWGIPWGSDPGDYRHLFNVVVENNLVRRACNGGYNECITVANGVNNIILRNNEVTESGNTVNGGEGIDIKEGVFGGQLHGNYVHDLEKAAIYLDAAGVGVGPGGIEDIDISGNLVRNITAGEGITLGGEGRGSLRNIRVFNNVVHAVNKNGLVLYLPSTGTGTATGITFINNTSYNNVRYGVRIDWPSALSSGILARNNIGYLNGYGNWSVAAGASATEDHNLWGVDPLFVDAASGNFRLRPGSPAVDAGSPTGAPAVDYAGVSRPQGAGVDIGAFELVP